MLMSIASPLGVSIPHRYGKNKELEQLADELQAFPFLIGTVRTSRQTF